MVRFKSSLYRIYHVSNLSVGSKQVELLSGENIIFKIQFYLKESPDTIHY